MGDGGAGAVAELAVGRQGGLRRGLSTVAAVAIARRPAATRSPARLAASGGQPGRLDQLVGHERGGGADLVVQALVLAAGVHGIGRDSEERQAGGEQDDQRQHEPQAQGHRASPREA